MNFPRCYMCDLPGSTVEHVPPRALFPEAKDVEGDNYRMDLITVPSCPGHNTAKSDDDEFLMVSLAGIIGNNSIGYLHKVTKVDRAIRRSSFRLIEKSLVKNRRIFKIEIEKNKFIEVIWGSPDVDRLRRSFDRITRGLHLHHFGKPLIGATKPILGYLFHNDRSAKNFNQFITDRAALDLAGKPRHGKNQDIFYYQVTEPDEFGLYLFRLCFYGGINVYEAVIPQGVVLPPNLAFELMNRGIKTIFTLGDKSYEIN
jgi:hypothetical protein